MLVILKNYPSGSKIQTVRKLNAATRTAAETAFRKSCGFPTFANATMLEVIDVPILAPIIIGIACLIIYIILLTYILIYWSNYDFNSYLTVIRSAPTIVIKIEVEVEELWHRTVTSIPITSPQKGFERIKSI